MNRLWKEIMLPIIKFKNIKSIVEVGAEKGINTKNILSYCLENEAKLISIDPEPMFDVNVFKEEYGIYFTFYKELSLERLPLLKDYDCILIDGDHNWYTVYHELQCIYETFNQDNFPLIFLHDVSWPYGRRDLYYNPDNIPKEYLNEYSQLGMHPDSEELLPEYGLNTSLFNANKENTPKNGVLTAVEDFIEDCSFDLELHIVPMFFGLGILHKKDDELSNFIRRILCSRDILNLVELFYIKGYIQNAKVINQRTKKISEIENVLSSNKSQLNKLNAENSTLKDEIGKFEKEFDLKNNLLDSLNQTNVILTKNNESQINVINSLKDDLEQHNRFTESFIEKNNILNDVYERQKTEIQELTKTTEDLKEENIALNKTVENQFITINNFKDNYGIINENLRDYKVRYSEKAFDLNQANYKVNRLFKRNESLINKEKIASDEITLLKNELDNANELISNLNELVEEKELELNNLNEIYQNTVAIKYNLEQENSYLKNSNQKINSDKKKSKGNKKLTNLFKIGN